MTVSAVLERPPAAGSDREAIEDFLYAEAELLDGWRLADWRALFTADGRYEVAPLNIDDPDTVDPARTLFLIADDAKRIEQRTLRLLKKTAHAEYPRSRTRHMISNVRFSKAGEDILTRANFVVYRVRREEVMTYIGRVTHHLRPTADGLRIVRKRAALDLGSLKPQGTVSIIL